MPAGATACSLCAAGKIATGTGQADACPAIGAGQKCAAIWDGSAPTFNATTEGCKAQDDCAAGTFSARFEPARSEHAGKFGAGKKSWEIGGISWADVQSTADAKAPTERWDDELKVCGSLSHYYYYEYYLYQY